MRLTLLKYLITRVIGRDESTILPLHNSQPPRDNRLLNIHLPELPSLSLPSLASLPPVPIFIQKCIFVCKTFAHELHLNVWLAHNYVNFTRNERMIILDCLSPQRDRGEIYEDEMMTV